jgi:hypothetical protein
MTKREILLDKLALAYTEDDDNAEELYSVHYRIFEKMDDDVLLLAEIHYLDKIE